jgi:GPH family glycoside/pentoside/hexuronide:cation symporter
VRAGQVGGASLLSALRDVAATRASRRLIAVQFIEAAGVGAVGTMSPYIAEYLLRQPEVVGLLPAAYVISGVLAIPVWVRVSKSYGKRETWVVAMVLAALSFGAIWSVGPGDLVFLMTMLVVAGAAMGCGGVLGAAILADVIDLDEQRTGERKEGVYSAAMTLALKVGTALAVAASGPVMHATGFTPNVEQTDTSLFGIRILFSGMPCVGFVVGAWIFRNFTLEPDPDPARAPAIVKAPSAP